MIFALAPMDGITNLPYRTIVNEVFAKHGTGGKLRTWTEFMNCNGYMISPNRLVTHLIHHDQEKNLIAQLYGGNRETLVQTLVDVQEKYPQFMGMELNIGCPSPKVIACGGGSGMMRSKQQTLETIKAMSKVSTLPFSIKVRTGVNQEDKKERFDILVQCLPYVHCVSIHGRTIKQGHVGECDWDYIHEFKKEAGDKCLVIGNGGIKTYQQSLDCCRREETLLDGSMTAQAAIANPRIFTNHTPSLEERFEVIMRHLLLSVSYETWREQNRPDLLDDTSTNKAYLHALKKYDPDSDESFSLPPLKPHNYKVEMPTLNKLEEKVNSLQKAQSPDQLELTSHRSVIEFRKYLFNYIKGLPGSKELKQEVAGIQDFLTLKRAIQTYFESLISQ